MRLADCFHTVIRSACFCLAVGTTAAAAAPDIVWFGPGHVGVTSVAVSPDGLTVASSGFTGDGTVKLWHRSDGTLIRTLAGNAGSINSVVFTPDGQNIVTGGDLVFGSDDPQIKLRRVSDGAVIQTYVGHTFNVNQVAVSQDGTMIASASNDQTVKIWDLASGTVLQTLVGHAGNVFSVAFSPDGTKVVSCDGGFGGNAVIVWNVADGTMALPPITGHTFFVKGVCFSPDGSQIISGSWDGTVRQWDAATGAPIRTIPTTADGDTAEGVAVSPDGQWIAAALGDGTVRVWDRSDGSLHRTLTGHATNVNAVVFEPNNDFIASCALDGTIRFYDIDAGVNTQTFGHHVASISSVAFSTNKQFVCSGSFDRTVRLWDGADGTPLHTLVGHGSIVNDVDFSPDDMMVASAGGVLGTLGTDGLIRLWNTSTGGLIRTIPGQARGTSSVDFSPDGSLIASAGVERTGSPLGNRGTVRVWDVSTGALFRSMPVAGLNTDYRAVAYAPDGQKVAAAGGEGIVRVYDVDTETLSQALPPLATAVVDLAYSPDGQFIAAADELSGDVVVFRLADGTIAHQLHGSEFVQSIAFSPDGSRLISGSGFNRNIVVWNLADESQIAMYDEEMGDGQNPTSSVAMSSDGLQFVYGRTDATLFVANFPAVECPNASRGDANCDAVRDLLDVDPFVLGLIDRAAYEANFPCNADCVLDVNQDSLEDGRDISAFIDCVVGGTCP